MGLPMRKPTYMCLTAVAVVLLAVLVVFAVAKGAGVPGNESQSQQSSAGAPAETHGVDADQQFPESSDTTKDADTAEQAVDASDAPQEPREVQPFVMPEGARYEPQTVVVGIPEGMTDDELQDVLGEMPHARLVQSEDGVALLEIDEGTSVEEAIDQLNAIGAFDDVQPNYLYTALEDDGVAALSEALDAYESSSLAPVGSLVSDGVDADEEPAIESGAIDDADGQGHASDQEGGSDYGQDQQAQSQADEEPSDPADVQEGESLTADVQEQTDGIAQLAETLEVNDPLAPYQYNLSSVHAREAWSVARAESDANGNPVTVGVLDTGFYADHEDLADNVVLTYNAVDGGTNVNNGSSYSVHGTHVAGVLSARANNGLGVAGVSHNARLALVLVASSSGEASSYTIARSIDYLLERRHDLNLRVINISMGASYKSSSYQDQDKLVMRRVDEAFAAGVVTVAAAGNRSNRVTIPNAMFPSDLHRVVSVISVNEAHEKTGTSNYNRPGEDTKNISAPGDAVLSTNRKDVSVSYGGVWYKGYTTSGGTSFATPCASAILALEFSANPSLTAEEAVNILYGTADDIGEAGWDELTGYGEAMAYDAVRAATGIKIVGPQTAVVGDGGLSYSLSDGSSGWRFSSSDSQVLSVDARTGSARARSAGTATVVATNGDGASLVKTVRVYRGIAGNSSIGCDSTTTYAIDGADDILQSWTWSTSDTSVATIGSDTGVLTAVRAGTVTVTATSVADPSFSMSKVVEIVGTPSHPMYRLYNPYTSEHFYTASEYERDELADFDWNYEGIGWYAPDKSSSPVYRLYNPIVGDHHYTLSAFERDDLTKHDWIYEGIGWYSDDQRTVPVRREYNPGLFARNHNFTTSQFEHDYLVSLGWDDEGIGWYAVAVGGPAA